MAWLLIDNSNSRTKFALGDPNGLLEWRAVLPTAQINEERLGKLLDGVVFDKAVFASVVPRKADFLKRFFRDRCDCHALSHLSPLGFGFDLPHPEQIGNDRLANVRALKERHSGPAVAIDFGTAVTFSILSAGGDFSGGVIAPGIAAMTEYLASRTAQLPLVEPIERASAIGKNTVEAMQVGAVLGHRGMVREIVSELVRELGGAPAVVATGGGAGFFASGCPGVVHEVVPDLTLEGLRQVGKSLFHPQD